MDLSDAQLDRYARHIVLIDIGGAGQKKLLGARVLVVGAGGLGAPVLHYLAAAGVGTLGIVDDDSVDLSNLQRQVIHRTADIGRRKTQSAADAIAAINPDVHVIQHDLRLTAENAADIICRYDIVADGCDNFTTRFVVNACCVELGKTLVSAAVGKFEGQLATFRGHGGFACYRCFVREAPGGMERSCADAGVLGALTGVMGSLQALEVIREITGFGETMAGRLMIYDAMSARTRLLKLPRDPECPTCGHNP